MSALEKVRLGGEIMRLYVRAQWGLRREDLPTVLADLRGSPGGGPAKANAEAQRSTGRLLGKITTRMLSALPPMAAVWSGRWSSPGS